VTAKVRPAGANHAYDFEKKARGDAAHRAISVRGRWSLTESVYYIYPLLAVDRVLGAWTEALRMMQEGVLRQRSPSESGVLGVRLDLFTG
jgi:hypothetical protein